jgi:hypothetical protein
MKKLLRYALVAALPLALLPLLGTQLSTQLSAQVNQDQGGITRQQADEMLKELRQIRQLLGPGKPPAPRKAAVRARNSDLSGVAMPAQRTRPSPSWSIPTHVPLLPALPRTAFAEFEELHRRRKGAVL